jgi:SAM-dependent methyltransferase
MNSEAVCNVCRDSRCKELAHFTSDLDKQHYHVMRCRTCGLLFLHPLPDLTPQRLEEIYGREYTETVFPEGTDKVLENALHRQMKIVEQFGKKGDVLNVGAMAFGMQVFKDRGWKLRIVDASRYAVERARSKGDCDITLSKIEDFDCPPESFDFVKLGHVIEHLKDPALALEKIWRLLRKGGLVLIDTDNAEGLETRTEAALMWIMQIGFVRHLAESLVGKKYHLRYGRLTPPVHLYTFTFTSLTRLLESKGFEIVITFNPAWGDPTWFPLSKRSMLETAFQRIDQLGARFHRGNVIAILARKKTG